MALYDKQTTWATYETTTKFTFDTPLGDVVIYESKDIDKPVVDATLAYAAVLASHGRAVQSIKFIRAQFKLGLKEAKGIYDMLRNQAFMDFSS